MKKVTYEEREAAKKKFISWYNKKTKVEFELPKAAGNYMKACTGRVFYGTVQERIDWCVKNTMMNI